MPTGAGIQHATDVHHPRLSLSEYVLDRSQTGKQGSAIFERNPVVRPRLAEVNIQSLVDAYDERNPSQRVLAQPLAFRVTFPFIKSRRGDTAEQPARLRLAESPPLRNIDKDLDRTRTEPFSLA